jgi:hypothetical protein
LNLLTIVVVLLAVAILLICLPQERRAPAAGRMVLYAAAGLAVYYLVPILFGLLWTSVEFFFAHLALAGATMMAVFVSGLVGTLGWLRWQDVRDNRAIRSGSLEAFEKRVHFLEYNLSYSHSDALRVTTSLRDGK